MARHMLGGGQDLVQLFGGEPDRRHSTRLLWRAELGLDLEDTAG